MNSFQFNINKEFYIIVNQTRKTRNGFAHDSVLMRKNEFGAVFQYEQIGKKISAFYLNRTWESFQFESVMRQLIHAYFDESQHKTIWNQITLYK